MQRPAEQLVRRLNSYVKRMEREGVTHYPIYIKPLREMLKWAVSIDARMRLDGSRRSRQKKPAKSGVKPNA